MPLRKMTRRYQRRWVIFGPIGPRLQGFSGNSDLWAGSPSNIRIDISAGSVNARRLFLQVMGFGHLDGTDTRQLLHHGDFHRNDGTVGQSLCPMRYLMLYMYN